MPLRSPRSYFLALQRPRSGLGKPGILAIRLGAAVRCSGHLTSLLSCATSALTYKTGEGDRTGHRALLFPSFKMGVVRSLPTSSKCVIGQMGSSNFRSSGPGTTFSRAGLFAGRLMAADITSERFGVSAPVASPQKTGIAHSSLTSSDAIAAFILNGKSLG